MMKEIRKGNSFASEQSHKCKPSCLGPLSFHCSAKGDRVCMSQGGRLAERTGRTFKDGLVFSNRPVKVNEKIHLRVEDSVFRWNGALRLGFTNVPPGARSLPLPCVAIPFLTDVPGHWAAPVHDSLCQPGSELKFWISSSGTIYVTHKNCIRHKLLKGVDLSKPLWAMIDIYGQTTSIFLLGSKKRTGLVTYRSCPAPKHPTTPNVDNHYGPFSDVSSLCGNSVESISCSDMEVPDECCTVCLVKEATITLPCDHKCLCKPCSLRFFQQFGSCPLCRRVITPSVEG